MRARAAVRPRPSFTEAQWSEDAEAHSMDRLVKPGAVGVTGLEPVTSSLYARSERSRGRAGLIERSRFLDPS
jgi:hypothetical protein